MKFKNIYITLLLLFMTAILSAQQDAHYSFYRYNMNLINPAYAGAGEVTNIGMNIRSQWASVQGAPETQSLIFGTPVGKNVGLGVSIVNDKTFIEKQTWFALDFSYRLQLNEGNQLFFGVKGGFASYNVNTEGLVTYGIQQDRSLMNLDGRFNPNIGAGAYLRGERYFVSLSIPRILSPDRLQENDGEARLGVDKIHTYLAGGYDFDLGGSTQLKPTVLFRYVDGAPLSVDFTTLVGFNERFDIGAAYRLNEGLAGLFLFTAKDWLQIGYAYEMATQNQLRSVENGTHELMLNLKL